MIKKSALLIGINYIGSDLELNGCINDVHNIKKLLLKSGYDEDDITIITDETEYKPTRKNILRCILELIITGNKELFLHYSGHGSYVSDLDGDERDGNDECLVPLDYEESGMISDDEIRGILQLLSKDQKMFVLMDCCHSGSNMDLAYNLYQRYGRDDFIMVCDSKLRKTQGQVIMISGCQDHQYSSDALIKGEFAGAMTASFLEVYRRGIRYGSLITKMRDHLKKENFDQIPNLSSGRDLKLSSRVKI